MSASRTFPSFGFRTLLTQHLLAIAAHLLLQRSVGRHSGPSRGLFWVEPKLSFRCLAFGHERRGLCYRLLQLRQRPLPEIRGSQNGRQRR
mgnify:CR=1 FL=1